MRIEAFSRFVTSEGPWRTGAVLTSIHSLCWLATPQDLSPKILNNRRALCPLLETLHRLSIPYKWKFPFTLNVTFQGKQLYLRTPNDLQEFCHDLQIAPVELPDCYREFCNPPKAHCAQVSPHSTPTKPPNKKGKYQKQHNLGSSSTPKHSNSSRALQPNAGHDGRR